MEGKNERFGRFDTARVETVFTSRVTIAYPKDEAVSSRLRHVPTPGHERTKKFSRLGSLTISRLDSFPPERLHFAGSR
jgi:hypothetical protein